MATANVADWLMSQVRRGSVAMKGTIVSVSTSDSSCTVNLRGTEVKAYYGDQISAWIDVGLSVTLVPVDDTLEVISTRGGSGGVGATYGPELLANPSFEYGTTGADGWAVYPWVNGTYATVRDTSPGQALDGSARLLVTLSPGPDNPSVNVWNTSAVIVDPGATYRVSAQVQAPDGDPSLTVSVLAITGATDAGAQIFGPGASPTTVGSIANPGGAYQPISGPVTIPAGHGFMRVFLRSDALGAMSSDVTVSWDSVSLRQQITT